MVQGAKTEIALKMYAWLRKRARRILAEKATSASQYADYLEDEYGVELGDISTELPPWFLQAASQRLDETFQKPYWQAVNDGTRDQIQSLIFQGVRDGMSIREISKGIAEIAPERAGYRATNCARTEVGNALNAGAEMGIRQTAEETGLEMTKVWLSVMGTTTRESHAAADGQEVPVDGEFNVGGESARWPGDENLSAGERCNCMCSLISGFAQSELDAEVPDADEETADMAALSVDVDRDLADDESPEAIAPRLMPEVPAEPDAATVVEPPSQPKPDWPFDIPPLDQLTEIPNAGLGGSTGARLYQDKDGLRYVVKRGSSPKHLREEFLAEQAYRALKVPVPDSRLVDDVGGQPVKISKFVEGKPLSSLSGQEYEHAIKQLQKGFGADALLANWDVAGLSLDNVIVGKDGVPYRIDVGGALRYRAQGGEKGARFGSHATEIWTLRDKEKNASGAQVFGDMAFKDVVKSSKDAVKRADKLIKTMRDTDPELAATLWDRQQSLKQMVDSATTLTKDKFRWEYADTFTKHEMHQDAAGLYKAMPSELKSSPGKMEFALVDANGKEFDDLRGQNGLGAKLRDYFREQKIPFHVMEDYAIGQSGSSWSKPACAMKDFIMRNRKGVSDDYWKPRGFAAIVKKHNDSLQRNVGGTGATAEKIDEARAAQHSFFTNFMRRIDMPGNNREGGYVEAVRTESKDLIEVYGLKKGEIGQMKRGAAESFSQTNVVVVKGDQLTVQQIPHHRVYAHYSLSLGSNSGCMLHGDNENEIVADTAGLDVVHVGEGNSREAVRRSDFEPLRKRQQKPDDSADKEDG